MSALLDDQITWAEFGRRHLDRRIGSALTTTLGLERPTLVQSRGIPVALEGKDLLCRARTGSGKTLCYAVPLVQRLLSAAEAKGSAPPLGGLVLVPTKELVVQVHGVITQLLSFSYDVLSVEPLISGEKYAKAELPTILVTTPSSVLALVKQKQGAMPPLAELLKVLVVDEADLMFSFGYEDDMRSLCVLLPATYQAVLVSATLSEEVEQLRGLMLHKPVVLKLEEPRVTGKLTQFYLTCKRDDKYLILYTLLKLQLVQGKKLMFVKHPLAAYKMKIFLERFSINSAVLNAELPHSSRQNILEAFNQGVVELLIATDSGMQDPKLADEGDRDDPPEEVEEEEDEEDEEPEPAAVKKKGLKRKRKAAKDAEADAAENAEEDGADAAEEKPSKKGKGKKKLAKKAAKAAEAGDAEAEAEAEEGPKKKKGKRKKAEAEAEAGAEEAKKDEDSGPECDQITVRVKRDPALLPPKNPRDRKKAFLRRGKREADDQYSLTRGVDLNNVSTVINADMPATVRDYIHRVGRCARGGASGTALTLCTPEEQPLLDKIIQTQQAAGSLGELKPLPMQIADAERFRYRVEDMARWISKKMVTQYLARELQLEALHSEKLKEYFEEHPEDRKALLRSQRQLRERKSVRQHLKVVPSYLVPEQFTNMTPVQQAVREDAAARGQTGMKKRRKNHKLGDPLFGDADVSWRKTVSQKMREDNIRKEKRLDPLAVIPEKLPPLSGRKLWKLRHKKRVFKGHTDAFGERTRMDHHQKNRRKKFLI